MKQNVRRKVFNILLTCSMIVFIALGVVFLGKTTVKADEVQLKQTYSLKEEIEIPDYYFGDGAVKAQKRIVTPDGSVYTGDKFVPETIGKYVIEYVATGYETYQHVFYVRQPLAETGNEMYEAYYGTNDITPNTNGLNVRIAANNTFTYNEIVDLNKSSKEKSFIKLYSWNENPGTLEFENMVIRLTDLYDETNYIDIQVKSSDGGRSHGVSYLSAGAVGQGTSGREAWNGYVHYNNPYGCAISFSLWGSDKQGNFNEDIIKNNWMALSFDLAEKRLYASNSSENYLVCDFDDVTFFPVLWDGFTDGKVRLSIYSKVMQTSTGGVVITDLQGHDLSKQYLDFATPDVTIEKLFEETPSALLGRAYPVYEAFGFDKYEGILDTDVAVYYNYKSPSQVNVDLVDGCFTPERKGMYAVEYTAMNSFGVEGKSVYYVRCEESHTPIEIQVGQAEQTGTAGYPVTVADIVCTGGVGDYAKTVSVFAPDGTPVEVKDGVFVPRCGGTFTVQYDAYDYVKSHRQASYNVVVGVDIKPVFDTDVTFFTYYVNSVKYQLPIVYAYDYNDGGRQLTPTIYVTDDQPRRALAGNTIQFSLNNTTAKKDVVIEYEVTGVSASATYTKTVTVVNVLRENGRLNLSKYFVANTVSQTADTDSVILTATQNDEITFANPLSAEQFSFTFKLDGEAKIGSFDIILTDLKDPTQQISFTFESASSGSQLTMTVGGGYSYTMSKAYLGDYSISYKNSTKTFAIEGQKSYEINTQPNGSAFNGFDSEKVYMTIRLNKVTAESKIYVYDLCGQVFSNAQLDRIPPKIVLNGSYGGNYSIGEKVTMPTASAFDVLDPMAIDVTLTVTDEAGNVLKSTDGISLINVSADRVYEVEVKAYGKYTMTYVAEDAAGRRASFPIPFTVRDMEAPTIVLSEENVTTAKVGDTLTLAKATFTDNHTASGEVQMIYLITPKGKMIDARKEVTLEMAGTYTIRYFAFDEAYNLTYVDYKLTVN